jgi:hypothetical protein
MPMRRTSMLVSGAVLSVSLGGCVSTAQRPAYTYYQVSCETPGAVTAKLLPPVVRPEAEIGPNPSPESPAQTTGSEAAETCVIPVARSSSNYSRGYYPGGLYGQTLYGAGGFGLFGLGGHGVGHGRPSHGVSGHGPGGHGGGPPSVGGHHGGRH